MNLYKLLNMKKINLLIIVVAAALMSACNYNEKNFPGYDSGVPMDIKTLSYTLVNADYQSIAGYNVNKDIAAANGVSSELVALTNSMAFSESLPASDYVPAFLAALYPYADNGSAIRVTYNYRVGTSSFYKLTSDDYTQIWNGLSTVGALTPAKSAASVLPALMADDFPLAMDGDVKLVEYQYSNTEPGEDETRIPLLQENFDSFTAGTGFAYMNTQADSHGWQGFATGEGDLQPDVRAYSGNNYVQFSAYRSTIAGDLTQEMWLVSPAVNIPDNTTYLSFETVGGYFNATTIFKVYIMDNADPTVATKTELTGWHLAVPEDIVSGSYTPFMASGDIDITAYTGIYYIGYYYFGNGGSGNSTTYQLDNFDVSYMDISTTVSDTETRFAYLVYQGGVWTIDNTQSFYQLTDQDYTDMGKTTLAAVDAPNYLPQLLSQKFPYAQQDDKKVVVYKISSTAENADVYIFSNGAWTPETFTETRTDQFQKIDGAWAYNPSVTINLPQKKDATIIAYYQAAVDWVWENIDIPAGATAQGQGYVTSYGNNDYYGGMSAYYPDVDWRPSAARAQMAKAGGVLPDAYPSDWTDAQVVAQMQLNLIEELGGMLHKMHPDVTTVKDMDVIFTISMLPVFTGDATNNYTLQYRVVGQGQFEYVEDSFHIMP